MSTIDKSDADKNGGIRTCNTGLILAIYQDIYKIQHP